VKSKYDKQTNHRLALTAAGLAIAFFSSASFGAQIHSKPTQEREIASRAKSASIEHQLMGSHVQKARINAAERKPSAPTQAVARMKYGSQEEASPTVLRPSKYGANVRNLSATTIKAMAAAPAATCNTSVFATSSGTALVNAVKTSTSDCINELFSLTGTAAGQTFNEAKMVTIADAFRTTATSYNGTNSGSALQMVMFLRAGYYVNYYNSAATGPYGATLKTSIRAALDAFANNGNFGLVNDAHGEVLSEYVILVDSSEENARYLNSVVKRILTSYNSSYNAYWWMRGAVNNTYTVLFRGHQNADFKSLVQSDTSIIDTLYGVVNNNFNQLGTDNGYLVSNAGRELSRFLQYPENGALKNLAKARTKLMIDRSNVTGPTASLWVGVGEMVDYYDKANCSYYSLCDFVTRLETNVLPIKYNCSPTLRIRAQSMTQAQLAETCQIQAGQETYFHQQAATNKIPVANDNNTQLEMNVFSSSSDYGTYAGAIFGIDTNNGGMYLEGDPAVVGNQARFIAYQAEWLLPKFEIWNLTHEYVHYLDGRFNLYGDFNAAMGVSSVWWIEGFAEYMSYGYRKLAYDDAKSQAAAGTYSLSTIFKNDYNSGQTRVYNWGYLAVRYMFEKQRGKVSNVLGYFRPGNFSGYSTYMNGPSMGTSMDTDFKAWLPCVNTPTLPNCGSVTPPANVLPVANFTSTVSNLSVNFVDTSTDSDGTIASRSWSFGDGTTSTLANPSKTYTAAGTYSVKLTVTDNSGGSATTTKTVTVTATPPANVLPVAKFVSSISGLTVTFTDQSTDSDGTIASRAWTFGDGTTSTLANPSKTYTAAGTYTVKLTVTDNKGGSATISQTVTVTANPPANVLPVAKFASSVSGLTVNFTDQSTDSDGTIASRAWTFGDGTTSTLANPTKTFTAAGTYNVSLTVTDNKGGKATSNGTVTVTSGGTTTECTGSPEALGKNCTRSNLSGRVGDYAYLYLYVPAGTKQIVFTSTGGTGNADMYVSLTGWATTGAHHYRSTQSGNVETVTVNNPTAGTYIYVSMYGKTAFSGVQVKAQY
jgi:microbial collagenase